MATHTPRTTWSRRMHWKSAVCPNFASVDVMTRVGGSHCRWTHRSARGITMHLKPAIGLTSSGLFSAADATTSGWKAAAVGSRRRMLDGTIDVAGSRPRVPATAGAPRAVGCPPAERQHVVSRVAPCAARDATQLGQRQIRPPRASHLQSLGGHRLSGHALRLLGGIS